MFSGVKAAKMFFIVIMIKKGGPVQQQLVRDKQKDVRVHLK